MNQEKDIQIPIKEAIDNAITLLEADNYQLAEEQLSAILSKYPNEPNSLRLSGVSSIDQGKPENALIPLQRAIMVAPDFTQAHEDLATAWLLLNDLKKSEICLKTVLKLEPHRFHAWKSLGDILSSQGKEKGARKAYEQALSTDPMYEHLKKALNLVKKGQPEEAEKIYKQILKDDSKNVNALRLLALLASNTGKDEEAIIILKKCVEIAPDNALAWGNLANLYRRRQGFKNLATSKDYYKKALKLRPNWAHGWAALGTIYTRLSIHDKGIEAYQKSINLKETQPRVHLSLGHVYKTIGQQDLAIKSYHSAIDHFPLFGESYWSLANLKTYKFTNQEVNLMEKNILVEDLAEKEKVHFLFALGKAYEDRYEYQKSFNFYNVGNNLNRGRNNYDPRAIEAITDRIINFFNEDFFSKTNEFGAENADPIFIVGLPRSGSTLVEQILSSHSLIEGTMELPNMMNIARTLGTGVQEDNSYPETLSKLSKKEVHALGKRYISETEYLRSGSPFFIDKMPNNFSHIGLINLTIPNAKIIDVRRNPMDTCFSCFKQLFSQGQVYTYDLSEIARYYINYIKLMDHWDEVLPGKVHRIIYEDLVKNQEEEIRKLLNYCDLEFEDQCLKFYETKRAVKTASSEQVRQPIYNQSVQLWQNYEEFLDQLKLSLSPLKARHNIPD